MDIQGFITDPTVKVVPSQKFKEYLSQLNYVNGMPKSIAKFNKENVNIKDFSHVESDKKKVNAGSLLQPKDFKLIKKLTENISDETVFDQKGCNVDEVIKRLSQNKDTSEKEENKLSEESVNEKDHVLPDEDVLRIADLEWLSSHLEKTRKDGECHYLHEFLEGSNIILPENETIKRNPVLEARCVKLRRDQMNRDYRAMTRGVDNVRVRQPEETIAYQIKNLNKQLIAVLQFVLSIAAGFLFGFIGVELMIGRLDFGFRLLLGIMCALIIALAEIYFLAKKLNEEMNVPETVQIGGPPVFANDNKEKPHND